MNLSGITAFEVTRSTVRSAEEELRNAGRAGHERFVLWSGRITSGTFRVTTQHVPAQVAYRLRGGLCVKVDGDELFSLNKWLFENGEVLAIQIHSHAEHAYHSDTDNEYPIVTQLGGLSIVVPGFCKEGLFGSGTAIYRLGKVGWVKEQGASPSGLLKVV